MAQTEEERQQQNKISVGKFENMKTSYNQEEYYPIKNRIAELDLNKSSYLKRLIKEDISKMYEENAELREYKNMSIFRFIVKKLFS